MIDLRALSASVLGEPDHVDPAAPTHVNPATLPRCPTCKQEVPLERQLIGPQDVAMILGVSASMVRKMDNVLHPNRTPRGERLYVRGEVYARALAKLNAPIPAEPSEWLTISEVSRILNLSEQRLRDMDKVLEPTWTETGRRARRYHRAKIAAEVQRRGLVP